MFFCLPSSEGTKNVTHIGATGAKKIENFVNDIEDFLVIEDETGRIKINNVNINEMFLPSNFVTGVACALYGNLNARGLFIPIDIEYFQIEYTSPMIKQISLNYVIKILRIYFIFLT